MTPFVQQPNLAAGGDDQSHADGWHQFASQLPAHLPDEAYDAIRDKYFNENVAPKILAAGYGLDTVHKQFMSKTERADKSSTPRLSVVGTAAVNAMAQPFAGGQPGLQHSMQGAEDEAAQEATQQGIEPGPYQFAGGVLGQLPFWAAGMEGAEGIASAAGLHGVLEKAIKTAAGGVIQGSYDLLKTGNAIEGLKGAAGGAAMVAGFEGAGSLWQWLHGGYGVEAEQAKAIEAVAKGVATDGQWQGAIDASIGNSKLDYAISDWVGQQIKSAKQAGVAKELIPDFSMKGLKIEMTGADGQQYKFASPQDAQKTISRIGEHLEAGGSLDKVTGSPKAVSQFYQLLSLSNPDTFDVDLPVRDTKGGASSVSMPVKNDEVRMAAKAAMDVHALVNARDSYYHATDLDGFKGILESGEIAPGRPSVPLVSFGERIANAQEALNPEDFDYWLDWHKHAADNDGHVPSEHLDKYESLSDDVDKFEAGRDGTGGVSTSRAPRVASKADKAITLVIDRTKMPESRPYVEEGFGKVTQSGDYKIEGKLPPGETGWEPGQRNPHFEFEQRTYNDPIPLNAVKGVLVDKSALNTSFVDQFKSDKWGQGMDTANAIVDGIDQQIQQIQQWAKQKGLEVKLFENGQDLHTYRAGFSKLPESQRWQVPLYDQLETLDDGSIHNKLTGEHFDNLTDAMQNSPSEIKSESPELVRGSADIPLSEKGKKEVDWMGQRVAAKGGLDYLVAGNLQRTRSTASAILDHNPTTQILDVTDKMQSWASGELEGAEHTPEIGKYKDDLAKQWPDHKIGGMAPESSRPGESFNDLKQRVLPYMRSVMQDFTNYPTQKIGVVTHFTPIRVIDGWLKAGMPDSLDIDLDTYTKERAKPSGVYRMAPNEEGQWKLRQVNMENDQSLQPGIYLIRHGETPWNKGGMPPEESASGSVIPEGGEDTKSGNTYKETPLTHRMMGKFSEMPDEAQGATIGADPGVKPTIMYDKDSMVNMDQQQSRELIFHENLHGHFSYLGISDWLNSHFDADYMVRDLFRSFGPEAKALYGDNGIPEEVFNYTASAVRTGNQALLNHFAEADTSMEHVLNWVTDTSRDILEKASEAGDSLHKRTLQRRLNSVVSRASGSLEEINRPFAPSDVSLDIDKGMYVVRDEGKGNYFDDRQTAIDFMESRYQEPLQVPELVSLQNLPDGVPKYATKFSPPSETNPPVTTVAPSPEIQPGPIKAGTFAFSYFVRPFNDWLSSVADKFNRGDLYSAFSQVEDAGVKMQNALRPETKTLRETLGQHSMDRQTDFLKYLQADEQHKDFVANELHLSAEELQHIHDFKDNFMGGLTSSHDLMTYIQQDMPRLRDAGYNVDTVFPKGKDTHILGQLLQDGQLDGRNSNLAAIADLYARKTFHQQYLSPVLDAAEDLVGEKAPNGKPAFGQLAPLLRRQIAAYRGVPDFTQRALHSAIEATTDSINEILEKANTHLPEGMQIPTISTSPREVLNAYTTFSYAGTLALKPAVLIRDALQLFITTFPILGSHTFKGMERAFEATKEGAAGSAWKTAQKYGAFLERRDIQSFLGGGEEETNMLESWATKALAATQNTHNSNRLVAFWGHQMKIEDALNDFRASGDVERFTKDSAAWFMNDGMRKKYLTELKNLQPEGYDDYSKRMAADLVGTTQWNYRPGQTPGLYRYGLGRLFGQYGTWPLNYIEYARRFMQGADRTEGIKAMTRLVAAHGAVMSAGASVGIDTSKWVFANPAAWSGGPLLETTLGLPSIASSSQSGQDERQQLKELLLFPGFVPGGDEIHSIYQAVTDKSPNVWIHALGFKPTK